MRDIDILYHSNSLKEIYTCMTHGFHDHYSSLLDFLTNVVEHDGKTLYFLYNIKYFIIHYNFIFDIVYYKCDIIVHSI